MATSRPSYSVTPLERKTTVAARNVLRLRSLNPAQALRSLAACIAASTLLGCSAPGLTSSRGAPCGRSQHGLASVTLPDTGINAGREIQVSFVQHDPDLSGELSEVAIQHAWPGSTRPDSEPDPRVRLISGSGRIFLDTLGTRFDQSSGGRYVRPTWYVLHWFRDAGSRNALYDAFVTETLWLELRRADAAGHGTRVKLSTKEFGVSPPAICL